ncbi:hypothetical protein B0H14DRAFT_2599120 [Mycena olivaceomarginata]|nr:hypothetical protein B0H14DRAFT_2599120 [Mycena olivaceomarginata]
MQTPGIRLAAVGQEITLDSRGILFLYAHSSLFITQLTLNNIQAILLTISMLAFVRNRATNVLILGLFFKISGTSSLVVLMLSNADVCVSSHTVEHLKSLVLKTWSRSQKRIWQSSLHSVANGQMRHQQTILPTPADDEIVGKSFVALIAEMIVAFTPGNSRWKDRKNIAAAVADMMPKDRPLPPTAADARPFGLFDVSEGSKKGVVKFLRQAQERSTLAQRVWSSIWRILRHGTPRASHILMRTHYGHAVEDPGSLAAHKGLLNRKWDVNKPNYAAAKSLIRHSLIARILHCVMVINGFTLYSQLSGWEPTLADIQAIALAISTDFATATAAQKAQDAGDDWMAHSIYFIRDSLFFCMFEKAVSFADPGQLIRVLRYWGLAFRGVGQHNCARECAEVLIRWKYELPDKLRRALERSWFVNRWGIIGRSIASDLYLEQLNFWVKRVFIASGSGVTIDYIIRKGSACVDCGGVPGHHSHGRQFFW